MTETILVFDGQSLAASGGTATSEEFSVLNQEQLKIQVIGDGSSTSLDGKLLARVNPDKNTFGEDKNVFTGEDLTAYDNNSKIFTVDVRGLSAVKLDLVNNAASSTTVSTTGGAD